MTKPIPFPILSISCFDYEYFKAMRTANLLIALHALGKLKINKKNLFSSMITLAISEVLVEFLGKTLNSTADIYSSYRLYRKQDERKIITDPPTRKLIKLEAELWVKIWLCLESSFNLKGEPVGLTFFQIVRELDLVMLFVCYIEGNPIDGSVQKMLQNRQHQNRLLSLKDENPFDKNRTPYTHLFIERCFQLANSSESFSNELYKPMVRSRMRTIQELINSKPTRFVKSPDGRIVRLGKTGRHRDIKKPS